MAQESTLKSKVSTLPQTDGRQTSLILIGLGIAALVVAPLFVYPMFLMTMLCFALFAAAFNLLMGFGGLLSFGHAAYFGLSAYVTAHAAKVWGLTPELSIGLGIVAASLLGLVFGALAIRRTGIYFSMVTLALAQMVYFFCLQSPFTHGEDGIQAVPRGKLFGLIDLTSDTAMYVLVAVISALGILLVHRIVHSPFGQVLRGIRENEARAISLGYRVQRYKLLTFVLSTAIAGLAGGLKATVIQMATLTDVHWTMSGEVVLMTLVGGVGTILGPVLGAGIVITMQNYLADLGAWVTVVQGGIFVACVLLFREGIVGMLMKFIKRTP